jgi:hypothetical protein
MPIIIAMFSCSASASTLIFHGIPASAGGAEPLPLPRTVEVDAGEDHGQLRRPQLDAVDPGGGGHLERPGLEPLVPDGQPVAIEVEDLEAIPAAVDEEEKMAAEEVLSEASLDQARQAVERWRFMMTSD